MKSRPASMPVNMAVIAGGTVAAQLINIVGFLIATRYIGPADFGMFGLHMAISAPIAILATGRYEVGFINAGFDTKVANLFILSVTLALIVTLVAASSLWGISATAGQTFGLSVGVVSALLFGQALVNCTTQLNNYNRSYKLIATSRLLGALAAQAAIVLAVTFGAVGSYALGGGMAFGMGVSSAVSLLGNASWLRRTYSAVSWNRMRTLARRNISYLLFNGPQALASALQESMAIAAITTFFGQAATGHYVFANRIMRAPISVVAESVGRVLQRQFGDMAHDITARDVFLRRSILYLAAFAIALCIGILVLSKPLVAFVFGPEWLPLGDLLRASAPYYAAYLVASSLAAIPLATGDHRPMAALGVAGSALYPGLLALAGLIGIGELATAFTIVSICMGLYFSLFVYAIYHFVIRRHIR